MFLLNKYISRNVANGKPADVKVAIKANSDELFIDLVTRIKNGVRRENYKRKQVGKSRLEYEITRL